MCCVSAGFSVSGLGVAIDARSVDVGDLIDVAITANGAMVWQAPPLSVIVSDTQPTGGVVAAGGCAICGEIRSHMGRDSASQRERAVPGSDVAARALRRQRRGIIIVHVAR